MGSRLKLGFIYTWDHSWIGGTYYVQNLINAVIEAEPDLAFTAFLTSKQDEADFQSTKYSLVDTQVIDDLSPVKKILNVIFRQMGWSAPFAARSKQVEVVYPGPGGSFFFDIKHKLYWIPDLQDLHFPEFFSPKEIDDRTNYRQEVIANAHPIVFSSHTARKDFQKSYPTAPNRQFVLHFAVTPPNLDGIHKEELLAKYDINTPYFICPNQFWKHKNHMVLMEAFELLNRGGNGCQLILTGHDEDRRDPKYSQMLKTKIDSIDGASYLGFIDRTDQLGLIQHSIAVIQPSLFEGWGTVVEDAKSLGKHVILSDIPVHREQIDKHCSFFPPSDSTELSSLMAQLADKDLDYSRSDYHEGFRRFGQNFLSVCREL